MRQSQLIFRSESEVLHYHPDVFNVGNIHCVDMCFNMSIWDENLLNTFQKHLQNRLLFRILLRKAVCCCQSLNLTDVHIFQIQQCQPETEYFYVNFMPVLCQLYA